jgi:hypothetical protein
MQSRERRGEDKVDWMSAMMSEAYRGKRDQVTVKPTRRHR